MATNKFLIPEIIVGQAQKEVTHNEGLAFLDALMKNPLVGEDTVTPPTTPLEGDIHTVGTGATGVWLGKDGMVAYFINNIWTFTTPFSGLVFYSNVSNDFLFYDGTIFTSYRSTLIGATPWGNITGILANQTDLQAEFNLKANITDLALKEDSLANPTTDGFVLSSTIAGVRSWIAPPTSGGSAAWGSITGTLTSQTDLVAALTAKEDALNNPTTDGDVLSSTIAGVRSWITLPAAVSNAWGSITGTLANQTDLQAALDAKEPSAGNPTVDGQVLSSTIAGVRSWITPSAGTVSASLPFFHASYHSGGNNGGASVVAPATSIRPINDFSGILNLGDTYGSLPIINGNIISVPAGIWKINVKCAVFGTGLTQIGTYSVGTTGPAIYGDTYSVTSDVGTGGNTLSYDAIIIPGFGGAVIEFGIQQVSQFAHAQGMGKSSILSAGSETLLSIHGVKIG